MAICQSRNVVMTWLNKIENGTLTVSSKGRAISINIKAI